MTRRKIKGPLAALESEMREEPDFYKDMKETITLPSSLPQVQPDNAISRDSAVPVPSSSIQAMKLSDIEAQFRETAQLRLQQNPFVTFGTLTDNLIEGDEVDFAGKKFHFVQSSGRRGSLIGRRGSFIGRRCSLFFVSQGV